MGVIIDTDVLIAIERGRITLDFLTLEHLGEPYITAINASELLVGVHRAADEAKRMRRSTFVEAIITRLPVLAFDEAAARTHAAIQSDLAAKGQMLDAHDLMIAAIALTHGFQLLTLNVAHFSKVPGLVLVAISP
jgi:predicted nucleic acid-binding protein